MTRTSPGQAAFSSGEVSPLLWRRTNYEHFQTGLRTCKGFHPLREGGFTRAQGTWHRGYTFDNKPARRIPFVFARNDAMELEFTDGKVRFWRYGQLVEKDGAPYELDTPFAEADLPYLDWVQSADVIYMADGQRPIQKLTRFALDDWTIEPAQVDDGPFQPQNLDEDKSIQCSSEFAPVIIWTANESGLTVGALRRAGEHVYVFVSGDNAGSVKPEHTSGTIETDPATNTYWSYSYTIATNGNVALRSSGFQFDESMVGGLLSLQVEDYSNIPLWTGETDISVGDYMRYSGNIYKFVEGSNTGVNPPIHTTGTQMVQMDPVVKWEFISDDLGIVRITSVIGGNHALADVIKEIPIPCIDSPTYRWSEGAWSDKYGYPRSLLLEKQSLYAARTPSNPRTLWKSVIGGFGGKLNFELGTDADDGFAFIISGRESQNDIYWLSRGRKGVYIGAMGEAYRAVPVSSQQAIGPLNFDTEAEDTNGVLQARPISPFGYPIYISKDNLRLNELRYVFSDDGGEPLELSAPAAHLGNDGFEQLAWQSAPFGHIWVRRTSGDLALCLYDPKEKVLGWATVPLAEGVVEDMCVSPDAYGRHDVLTLTVRRVIDGQTVRCVEEQAINYDQLLGSVAAHKANHLFAAIEFAADPETDTFNVPHLVGQQVIAWTDKGNMGPITVPPGGDVVLPIPVGSAIIGLFDDSHEVETLDLTAAARDGDSRGRHKRAKSLTGLMVHETADGKIQSVQRQLGQTDIEGGLVDLFPTSVASARIEGQTGVVEVDAPSGFGKEISHRFKPVGGAPLTVTGYVPTVEEAGL